MVCWILKNSSWTPSSKPIPSWPVSSMIQSETQAAAHGSHTAWLDQQEVIANDTSKSQLFRSGSLWRLEHLELGWVSASMAPLPGLWFQWVMEG